MSLGEAETAAHAGSGNWASGAPVGVYGRCTLGQRTRWLAIAASEVGQRTKSLGDSPLRGGKSREAVWKFFQEI